MEMLNFANSKIKTSEPISWHLFYDNTKCEGKKNNTLIYCYGSINFSTFEDNLVICIIRA